MLLACLQFLINRLLGGPERRVIYALRKAINVEEVGTAVKDQCANVVALDHCVSIANMTLESRGQCRGVRWRSRGVVLGGRPAIALKAVLPIGAAGPEY
jgi:hypothetical protein